MKRAAWLWQLAARNLTRNWRRNLVTGLAIAGAYAGILVFTGFVVWVEKYLRADTVYVNQVGHIVISREGGLARQLSQPREALLTVDEQTKVMALAKADPAVAMVGRGLQALILAVRGCRSRGVLALGRDPDIEAAVLRDKDVRRWNGDLLHPKLLAAWKALKRTTPGGIGVFPTPNLAHNLFQPQTETCAGDQQMPAASLQLLAKTVEGYTSALDTSSLGVQSTGQALTDEHTLFIPTPDLQHLLETDRLGYVSVYAKNLTALPGLLRRLTTAVQAAGLHLSVRPFYDEEVGLFYIGSVSFLLAVAAFFVVLVTATVTLTLLSLFSITIGERGTEIGVLAALGFPEGVILSMFEYEGLLLTLGSLSAGLASALGIARLIYLRNIRFAAPGVSGDTRLTIAWEPWIMVGTALLFIFSSWLAMRMIARIKLRSSPVQLLSGAATL